MLEEVMAGRGGIPAVEPSASASPAASPLLTRRVQPAEPEQPSSELSQQRVSISDRYSPTRDRFINYFFRRAHRPAPPNRTGRAVATPCRDQQPPSPKATLPTPTRCHFLAGRCGHRSPMTSTGALLVPGWRSAQRASSPRQAEASQHRHTQRTPRAGNPDEGCRGPSPRPVHAQSTPHPHPRATPRHRWGGTQIALVLSGRGRPRDGERPGVHS